MTTLFFWVVRFSSDDPMYRANGAIMLMSHLRRLGFSWLESKRLALGE